MSRLTHNVSTQADELLDHIYEYGTNSEGVIHRINQLCDAAVEQLRAELAASREREARMRAKLEYALQQNDLDMLLTGDEIRDCRGALAEGEQG